MAKKLNEPKKGKIKPEEFAVWVTLPRSRQIELRSAAGSCNLPMSEFARRAVIEAMRKVRAGETPFLHEEK